MEIELIVFEIFKDFDDSHILFECKVEFGIDTMSIGFLEQIKEGLHLFQVVSRRGSILLQRMMRMLGS